MGYRDYRLNKSYQDGLSEGRHISRNIEEAMAEANERTEGAYHAKSSGDYGEYSLKTIVNSLPEYFHVINDVMIQTKKGSTQLDHIIVSPFGIYVIETKNHKGMIFGDANGKVWTQVLNGRGHFTLYNPLWQNQGHIKHLSEATKIPERYMIGLVVFTNPEANIDNARPFALNPDDLYRILLSNTTLVLSQKGIDNAIDRIDAINSNGYRAQQKHVEYVKSIKEQDEIRRARRKLLY